MVANEIPPRPYIPPAFAASASCRAAKELLLDRAWRRCCTGDGPWLDIPAVAALLVLGTAGLAFSAAIARRLGAPGGAGARPGPGPAPSRRRRAVGAWLGWAAVGTLVAAVASAVWVARLEASQAALGASAGAYRLVVASEASAGTYGVSCTVEVRDLAGAAIARARLTAPEVYGIGTGLEVVGRIEPLDDSDWARSRFMRGEVASIDAVRVVGVHAPGGFDPVRDLRAAALSAIDPARSGARALIAGTVCGSTTELNRTDVPDAFSATGLSHLVAVSGSHLALIAALVQRALVRTRCSVTARLALMGCMSVAYVLFTGCSPSAVRSVIMVCLTMGAQAGGRRGHGVSSLALTVTGFTAASPGVVYDLGFQLSAASVLFIALFGRYCSYILEKMGLPRPVAEALSLTLAAQWATLPLTLPVFGQLSLIAPVANLVAGPLMSGLLVCGLAVAPACIALPGLGFLMALPEGIANLSIFVARLMSGFPLASIPVAADGAALAVPYAAAAAVYALWADPGRGPLCAGFGCALAAGAAWLGYWLLLAPPSVTVLDVGQADSILVRDGSRCVLVDAGVDEEVVSALARNHVFRLDAVVVTHWDRDHWGGLPAVLQAVDVGALLVARGAAGAIPDEAVEAGAPVPRELDRGDELHVGGFTCSVVWPRGEVTGGENADSLVLDVRYGQDREGLSVLLTGDAEADQEAVFAADVGDIDVLKLGHHGSAASVSDEVLDILRPEVAVASAGEGNAYGHPTRACIEAVEEAGARFLCTKDAGDVSIEPRGAGYAVRTAGR